MSLSRARFLIASGIGASGLALLDRVVARAAGADPGDLSSLNAAIELERAGIKAYDDAAATKLLSPKIAAVAAIFKRDHQMHLAALIAAVEAGGGTPSTKTAKLHYPQLTSENGILYFAQDVEKKAASTYLSVIPELKDRDLAGVIGSILGVETVHVGALAQALGAFPPYPSGFVK